ncbi:DUF262 domain-containing protein [Clavibacter sp. VKM Ac-2872]|uniref:DUF262 domain-containing protein n=1 Tax=Clavibacter sp. VKM Ac-2872 TaxID=2783812 RepID=UPI00188D29B8|nr:DUF262 domain-containing protein [Clavibacter sp. VKM Ac-2872]MBF4625370.1 DUF262 domain-containing protein [Clavibacter sp. VKM Ac-2872]
MTSEAPAQPLKAAEINLGKLFTDDYNFVIPEYQRPYTWGPEETMRLLSDLHGALERDADEPYFLGSVVLVKDVANPRSEVIDGQQRLTTLTLLISVLRDLVTNQSLRGDIHKFIEEPAVEWDDKAASPRLELRPRDAQFFREYVQVDGATETLAGISDNLAVTDSQRSLRDNARALRTELATWTQEGLQLLYKMMAKRTFVVAVITPDLNSAYRIFSVMNARGLPLSPPDIFKSQVIGAIAEGERSHFANVWEKLEEDLGREEFGDLFLYIRVVMSQTRAVRGLLQEFPEQVLNAYLPDDGKGFIHDVLQPYALADSRLVAQNFTGEPRWRGVNAWLSRLSQLDNDDWRPVALWALREHGDEVEFLDQFLGKLERLAASMLLRRVYATPRAQRYMDLLKQLIAGDGLASMAFELSPDEKAETLVRLGGEIYLTPPVRKYVLLRLDSILADDPGASYDHSTITVEHVLPQHPDAESRWLADFDEDQSRYWTHRLGNLLLLNRRKNSQAQNYDFQEKKRRYFASDRGVAVFALTTQVLDEGEWTPAVIGRRHEKLISVLSDAWRLA